MIRVLHIVGGSMSRAGMETFIMNVYRNIDTTKYQFDFLVHSDKTGDFDKEIQQLGGTIYRVLTDLSKIYPIRVYKRFLDTYSVIKANKEYDAIHIHASTATSLVKLLAVYFSGCRIRIVHSHSTNTYNKRIHKFFYRLIRIFSTHRFACSEEAGIWMYGKDFKNLKNSKVLNNGIDTNIFSYDPLKQCNIKMEFGFKDKFVIGHIGRFSEVKNHGFLIDVFYQIYKKNRNVFLLLIGDGELRKNMEEKVKQLSISHCVKFAGIRTDINEQLLAMDVMLFPSLYEGLPVTLVEAQATGLKIIASDTVSREANLTGLVTFVSLEKSSAVWAEILEEEAQYNRKDQRKSIKEAKYDIRSIADELCSVYEQK